MDLLAELHEVMADHPDDGLLFRYWGSALLMYELPSIAHALCCGMR